MTIAYDPRPSDVEFTRFLVRMAQAQIEQLMREAPGSAITDAEIEAALAESWDNSRHHRRDDIHREGERLARSARVAAFTARQIKIAERLLGLTEEDR